MATLADVEAAIARLSPADGFIVLDERLQRVAERPPLEGGGFVIVVMHSPDQEVARRPGDDRTDPAVSEATPGPTRARVEASGAAASAVGRSGHGEASQGLHAPKA